jgi:hypothetical protein
MRHRASACATCNIYGILVTAFATRLVVNTGEITSMLGSENFS